MIKESIDKNKEEVVDEKGEQIVRQFNEQTVEKKYMKKVVIIVYLIMIFLGLGTGYLLANKSTGATNVKNDQKVIQTDKVVGSTDEKTFKDSAEGRLEKGGIDGEGTHKLIRDGGPSQTVYLTSSVIDMDKFVGKDVKVWGETFAADKAGWLMDVGKIELK
jgi:hypothetical protein